MRRQNEAPRAAGALRYRQDGLLIDLVAHRVSHDDVPVRLTPKEFAVLTHLAHGAGRVVTQTQLLRDVWGPVHAEDTHYLRIVVSKLRQKLGDDPLSPNLLQTEAGIGYRLMVTPEQRT